MVADRVAAPANPPGWNAILLATATIGVSNSVVFALLGNLQDEYGFSDLGLGLIAGAGFVVGLIGQILFAPFADKGHSKLLLLLGLAAAVAGSISFALSSSLIALILSRCLTGASTSLYLPSVRAIAISVDRDNVARRLGVLGAAELGGFVIGPMIGGLLVGPFGIRVPFLVNGIAALVGLALLIPRKLPEPPRTDRHQLGFDLLRLPQVRTGVLLSMAAFAPVGFYDAVLDRFLTDLGATELVVGLSFLLFGLPFALLAPTGGRLVDRIGAVPASVIAMALVTPLVASYGFISVPIVIALLSGVEGCIQALGVPAVQSAVARAAPEGRAAAAQGLAGAGNLTMGAITAFSAGPMYGNLGPEWMFCIAAAVGAVLTVLAMLQRPARSAAG